jgi:hypothetical protein
VAADGTAQWAPNATVTHPNTGEYDITFAAGSFDPETDVIPIIMPLGTTMTGLLTSSANPDGSATMQIFFAADAPFNYIATGQP